MSVALSIAILVMLALAAAAWPRSHARTRALVAWFVLWPIAAWLVPHPPHGNIFDYADRFRENVALIVLSLQLPLAITFVWLSRRWSALALAVMALTGQTLGFLFNYVASAPR